MKTIDKKFAELCNEIDFWKEEAKYYKEKYEKELKERTIESHERLEEAKRGVGQALMLALSLTDNPDGSISISKENRKIIADSLEKK